MASGSFGQLVAWVAIAIVIVVFIVAVIDESDDHKPKDMFGRKRQPNVDAVEKKEQIYNKSVSEKVQELSRAIEQATDGEEMFSIVTDFYGRYGVGFTGYRFDY